MSTITKSIVVAALIAVALAISPGVASGSEAEERRGAELLRALERGEASCGDLSTDDFMALGERWRWGGCWAHLEPTRRWTTGSRR